MKRLYIYNSGCRRSEDEDEDEEYLSPTPVSVHEVDEITLASWSMPNLTYVNLRNILPSVFIPCSNVTSCVFSLTDSYTDSSSWDLRNLRNLLQSMPRIASLSMPRIASLSMAFAGEMSFHNTTVDPLVLSDLKSLTMDLKLPVPSQAIGQFLDLLDTERLTKLHIHAGLYSRRKVVAYWIYALFYRPAHEHDSIRSFSGVEEFSLYVWLQSCIDHPSESNPFSPMFAALPNVQVLSLTVPEGLDLDLTEWQEEYEGLRNLRSMCIHERSYPTSFTYRSQYSNFFSEFSTMEEWNKFERLEVVRLSAISVEDGEKERLEKYVGEKLVWKAGTSNLKLKNGL